MFHLASWLLIGISFGVITGLIPGLHPNTVIFILLPLYFSTNLDFTSFLVFVVASSSCNTVVNYIPSILLGVPESDTPLAVLPGHKYVQRGRGYEALKLTVYGAVLSTLFALITLPVLYLVVPLAYNLIVSVMPVIIVLIITIMLWSDSNKLISLSILFISGMLGFFALNSSLANTTYILFPLFTGFFAVPTVITSILQKTKIPEQTTEVDLKLKTALKGSSFGYLAGILRGFIPGIGSSQSALIMKKAGDLNLRDYMVSLGAVNTVGIFFSILALYLIGKGRSGAAVALQTVMESLTVKKMFLIIGVSLFVVGISSLLTLKIGKWFSKKLEKINYNLLLKFVLIFLLIAIYILTGFYGLLILFNASLIGFITIILRVKRSYCMGSLLIPVLLYYLGISTWLSSLLF